MHPDEGRAGGVDNERRRVYVPFRSALRRSRRRVRKAATGNRPVAGLPFEACVGGISTGPDRPLRHIRGLALEELVRALHARRQAEHATADRRAGRRGRRSSREAHRRALGSATPRPSRDGSGSPARRSSCRPMRGGRAGHARPRRGRRPVARIRGSPPDGSGGRGPSCRKSMHLPANPARIAQNPVKQSTSRTAVRLSLRPMGGTPCLTLCRSRRV
jgi:hypothetical protein